MSVGDKKLDDVLEVLDPIALPPADYPPAVIVRDTPRDALMQRIADNAAKAGIELTDEHREVINFLFDYYTHCCETKDPGYVSQEVYWRYVNCLDDPDCRKESETKDCPYGQLSSEEAQRAYPLYQILVKAFKDRGGKKHLYRLFPYGPLFTIHLLAQLPRLRHDVDPHFGTAY